MGNCIFFVWINSISNWMKTREAIWTESLGIVPVVQWLQVTSLECQALLSQMLWVWFPLKAFHSCLFNVLFACTSTYWKVVLFFSGPFEIVKPAVTYYPYNFMVCIGPTRCHLKLAFLVNGERTDKLIIIRDIFGLLYMYFVV